MAQRLTWDQVQGGNFSGANEAARMATNLLSTASAPLVAGIDGFQEAVAAKQSGELMQRVNGMQDPAAIAAALSSGELYAGLDPRYLSAGSQEFAAGQAQRLLTEDQTAAETVRTGAQTGLIGVQTRTGQFNLDTAVRDDQRQETVYAATQALEPIQQEIDRLARSGDITGAQQYAQQHAQLFRDADQSWSTVFNGIATQAIGGQTDYKTTDDFMERLRTDGIRNNARAVVEAAASAVGSREEFDAAMEQAVRQNLMTPEEAEAARKEATNTNLFPENTGALSAYGFEQSTPDADLGWLNPLNAGRLRSSESGSNPNVVNDAGIAGGEVEMTQPRIADAIAAGVLPEGTTVQSYARMPVEDQRKVEAWHWGNVDRQAANMGLEQYYGQVIQTPDGPVTINRDSIRGMAHIGGVDGARRFIESGGQYNPADVYGTRISTYGVRFGPGGSGEAPRQGPTQEAADRLAAERAMAEAGGTPQQPAQPAADPLDTSSAALEEAARRAAETATSGAQTLDAGQGPRLPTGDAAAARGVLAEGSTTDAVPQPDLAQQAQIASDNQQVLKDAMVEIQGMVDSGEMTQEEGLRQQSELMNLSMEEMQAQAGYEAAAGIPAPEAAPQAPTGPVTTSYGVTIQPPPTGQDPNQSGMNRDLFGDTMYQYVDTTTEEIASAIGEGRVNDRLGGVLPRALGNAYDYAFGGNDAGANAEERAASADATGWWQSQDAKNYFVENPGELAQAAQDPIGFAQQRMTEGVDQTTTEQTTDTPPTDAPAVPAEMPVDVGAVDATRLQEELRTVTNTLTVDAGFDTLGDLTAAVSTLPDTSNEGQIAAALVGEGGALSGQDQEMVRELIIKLSSKENITPRIAGAILAKVTIDEGDNGEGWFDLAEDPTYDTARVDQLLTEFMGTSDESARTLANMTARLNLGQRVNEAGTALGEVKTQFDQATADLNAYIRDPKTTEADAARATQYFNEVVFPDLRARVAKVNNTGLPGIFSRSTTGQ